MDLHFKVFKLNCSNKKKDALEVMRRMKIEIYRRWSRFSEKKERKKKTIPFFSYTSFLFTENIFIIDRFDRFFCVCVLDFVSLYIDDFINQFVLPNGNCFFYILFFLLPFLSLTQTHE